MVTAARRAAALGVLLLSASACGSFEPVSETRFTLLDTHGFETMGMQGAHWIAYDDQHSLTSACTNGAAGNHDPDQCSHVYEPHFTWKGSQCPQTAALDDGKIPDPEANSPLCFHGELSAIAHCNNPRAQCYDDPNNGDVSNMWGAGLGLSFSGDGKTPFIARDHGVRGVAFDLSVSEDTRLAVDAGTTSELNLRVEVPILLPATTSVPSGRPLMREDGSVIGTDDDKDDGQDEGQLYDCAAGEIAGKVFDRQKTTLKDVVLSQSETVTSELHPYGSPFWQKSADSDWGPSPVRLGHNEFEWSNVYPPPERGSYPINQGEMAILGVHFQVVHPLKGNTVPLAFVVCIKNLALLLE